MTYTGVAKIRVGRQIVGLNRSRFIGAKGFRQTMQVVDGIAINYAMPEKSGRGRLGFYGAWFGRVSTVTVTSRDEDMGIVRADWTWSSGNSLLASVYWHDKNVQPGSIDTSCRIGSLRRDGLRDAA